MKIESSINYWDGGLLNYDPERIRTVFFQYFPEATFDKNNYSRINLEKFFQNVKVKNLEPPEFVVDKYWELAFQNGPTFKFDIPNEKTKNLSVTIKRFHVSFQADSVFNDELEIRVIEFLKLLNYGKIISNQQTKHFSEISDNRKDYWTLK